MTTVEFTTEDAVREALEATENNGGSALVVADNWLTPWIVYPTEDGDLYAYTVPDGETPLTDFATPVGHLMALQPDFTLRLVWDGVTT